MGEPMLQRTVATVCVCYGLLYVIPVLAMLQDAETPGDHGAMWSAVSVVFVVGGVFVAAGSGIMSNAWRWRPVSMIGAVSSALLIAANLSIPTVFMVVHLAIIAGVLRFWFRSLLTGTRG